MTADRDRKNSQLEGAEERMLAEMKRKTKAFVENLVSERTAATKIAESKDAELKRFREEVQKAFQLKDAALDKLKADLRTLQLAFDEKTRDLIATQAQVEQERVQRATRDLTRVRAWR